MMMNDKDKGYGYLELEKRRRKKSERVNWNEGEEARNEQNYRTSWKKINRSTFGEIEKWSILIEEHHFWSNGIPNYKGPKTKDVHNYVF